jgi:hypothetical protein
MALLDRLDLDGRFGCFTRADIRRSEIFRSCRSA